MNPFFKDSGALTSDDPSYVEREADTELLDACRTETIAYVLSPRQTGKSSLVNRAITNLEGTGIRAACVDLTTVGNMVDDPATWYVSILSSIDRELGRDADVAAWWTRQTGHSSIQRFWHYLEDEVRTPGSRIVIFFDEIDAVRSLRFSTDEFFAAIRAFHNRVARRPKLAGLCFVLLGVLSPQELIRGAGTTPFNIGRPIHLGDFTPEQAAVLRSGMRAATDSALTLDRVLHWTAGHPRLTQAICAAAAREEVVSPATVDAVVDRQYVQLANRYAEPTLGAIERAADADDATGWLALYQQILGGDAPRATSTSEAQARLQLVGLVRTDAEGLLVPRNRLFRTVFGPEWLRPRLWRDRGGPDRLEALIRLSTDPVPVFNSAIELLSRDPDRLRKAFRDMRGSALATVFDQGALYAGGGEVVRLAEALEGSAGASALAAMLRAIDRAGGGHDRSGAVRVAIARRLGAAYRVVVHVVWRGGDPLAGALAHAIYRRLTRNQTERTAPGMRVPVLLHDTPVFLADDARPTIDPARVERTLIVVLAGDEMAVDPAWRACLDRMVTSTHGDASTTSLLPLVMGPPRRFAPFDALHVSRLPDDVDESRVLIEIELSLLRLLASPRGGVPDRNPARLFLSYAAVDGTERPHQILELIKPIAGIEAMFDQRSLAPGERFEALEGLIGGRVFVAFVTARYASRPWCRMEFLTAKRLGVPMVVVDAQGDEIARAFPYLGNVPWVRWRGDERGGFRIIETAVFEALRDRYLRLRLEDLSLLDESLRGATIAARPPELLDLFEDPSAGAVQLVLHPDPPINDEERELLQAAAPALRVVSPSQIVAERRSLRWPDGRRLRVGLSASPSDVWPDGGSELHFEDAWLDLTRMLVLGGATQVTGGDLRPGGTTDLLLELADRRLSSDKSSAPVAQTQGPPVRSYLAWPLHRDLDLARRVAFLDLVEFVAVPPPDSSVVKLAATDTSPATQDGRYLWVRSLTAMRRTMIDGLDALIVLGGRTVGYLGRYAGIVEEVALATAHSTPVPVFVLGGFGGAAAAIAEAIQGGAPARLSAAFQLEQPLGDDRRVGDFVSFYNDAVARDAFADAAQDSIDHDALAARLRERGIAGLANALDDEQNRTLLSSGSIEEVSALIREGLGRLIDAA